MASGSPVRKKKRSSNSNASQNRRRRIMMLDDGDDSPDFFLVMRYDPFPSREHYELQQQEVLFIRSYQDRLKREQEEWEFFKNEVRQKYICLRRALKEVVLEDPNFKFFDHLTLEARDYMLRLAKDEENLCKFRFSNLEIGHCLKLLVSKLELLDKEFKLFMDRYKMLTEQINRVIYCKKPKNIFHMEAREEDDWLEESEPCLEDDL